MQNMYINILFSTMETYEKDEPFNISRIKLISKFSVVYPI